MRSYNENYLAQFESETKKKRFTVRIDFEADNSDPVYLTSHSDSATPPSATVISQVFKNASVVSQELKPISSIGSTTIEAVDVGSSLTDLFRTKYNANKGLRAKRVRIYDGYKGQAWSDYEIQATYAIGNLSFKDGLYKIEAHDIQRIIKDVNIFDAKETRLRLTLSETETSRVYVYENDIELNPHGSSYSDAPNSDVLYIRINDEIIRCDGKGTDGTYGKYYSIDTNGRGALNTLAVEHSVDSGGGEHKQVKVTEHIYIEMPVVKLIYAILLGALNGQVGKTLPYNIGIDTEFVANDDFINNDSIKDIYDTSDDTLGTVCYFEGLTKINAKQFIERKLLPLISCFMPVYANGEIGLKRRAAVKATAPAVAYFDDSNIKSYSEFTFDNDAVRNQLLIHWHYNALLRKTIRTKRFIFSQSLARNQNTSVHEMTLEGVHGSRHSLPVLTGIVQRHIDDLVEPPIVGNVDVLPKLSRPENGDIVILNTTRIRDFTGSSGNINRAFEVVGRKHNLIKGNTNYKLRGSSGEVELLDIEQLSANVVDDADFQNGTEIDATSFSGNYTNIGGVGHLDGSFNLAGGSTMTSGSYWHDGDLTIDASALGAFTQNVRIWCPGHVTINSKLDGKANGIAGATGYTGDRGNTPAIIGGVGGTIAGGGGRLGFTGGLLAGILAHIEERGSPISRQGRLGLKLAQFNIFYDGNNIRGLPENMRGVGGDAGSPIDLGGYQFSGAWHSNEVVSGGPGGTGGAAIQIICRGLSFGASGSIDTSGGDAGAGNISSDGKYQAGGGAPGAAGGVFILIDGAGVIPDLSGKIVAKNGASAVYSETALHKFSQADVKSSLYDYETSLARVQLVPSNEAAEDEQPTHKPVAVSGLSLASNFIKTNKDGSVVAQINATWTPSTDPNVDHYQMQIKKSTDPDSSYRDIGKRPSRTDNSLLFSTEFIEGDSVVVRMRSVNVWRAFGPWITSGAGHTIIGKNANPNPATSLAVKEFFDGRIRVTWTNPNEGDLKEAVLLTSTTNNSSGATELTRFAITNRGGSETQFASRNSAENAFYWIQLVDTTNHSSTVYPATTAGVQGVFDPEIKIARTYNFEDYFETLSPSWVHNIDPNELPVIQTITNGAYSGSKVLRVSYTQADLDDGPILLFNKVNIPYHPDVLYTTLVVARKTASSTDVPVLYAGFAALDHNQEYIDFTGNPATWNPANHMHAAYNQTLTTSFQLFHGYTKGHGDGVERVTNGDFASATGWTYTGWTYANGNMTHDTGNTSALSQNTSATVGNYYTFAFSISGRTAGSVTVKAGNQTIISSWDQNGTFNGFYGQFTSNNTLAFEPTSDFDGTIDNVSVKELGDNTDWCTSGSPAKMHPDTKYIQPILYLNEPFIPAGSDAETEVDSFVIVGTVT